jgi:DNA invertase Pin-like site-specific DNA recombinase
VLAQLAKGRAHRHALDRLARSTHDLLNTLATITGKGAGFRSLNDAWADTTTAHGRLMLTVLGELIRDRTARAGTRQRTRRENGKEAEAYRSPEARGDQAPRSRRGNACGDWP